MTLSESDQIFIDTHNFDADITTVSSLELYEKQQDALRRQAIDAFIESHAGREFSLNDLMRETGSDDRYCKKVVEHHPYVRVIRGKNKHHQFLSTAPPLEYTVPDEPVENTDVVMAALGESARNDWYSLINERRKSVKKKYKVIDHY